MTSYRTDLADAHIDIVNRAMAQDRSRRLRSAVHLLELIQEETGEVVRQDIHISSSVSHQEDAADDLTGGLSDTSPSPEMSRPRKIMAALLLALIAAGCVMLGVFLSKSW